MFSKEVPYLTVLSQFQRKRKTLTSFVIDPSSVCSIDVFVELVELFPKLAELFGRTGRETISGPGNTVEMSGSQWRTGLRGQRLRTEMSYYALEGLSKVYSSGKIDVKVVFGQGR